VGSVASPLSVLLLADDSSAHANTILEHINALTRLSRHDVVVYNPRALSGSFALDFDEFDVIVIHYSLVTISDQYLAPAFRARIRRFDGLKIQIIQDDYRWVEEFWAMMRELGVRVLFTLVPEREIERVWPSAELPGVERITTLAGYVPLDAGTLPVPPLGDRPFDIVYRGRALPYWIGRLGQEKAWIAQGVAERAARYGLRCDVDWREGSRIYGRSWLEFLSSGRATLGSESGASITDFDGSLERRVSEYLKQHPNAGYLEVHRDVLAPYEGNVTMNVISPRVFEAIAVRTALVLFPGEYSGVLDAERHYIPLAKDFSNFDEVVDRLRDLPALQRMADTAFDEIIRSGRYSIRRFVERFDRALDEHGAPRARKQRRLRYGAARLERPLRVRAERAAAQAGRAGARLPVGAVKVALALGLVARVPALRRLLGLYVSELVVRRPPFASPLAVLEDLLKLALLQRLRTGQLVGTPPVRIVVSSGPAGDELIVRTLPPDGGATDGDRQPQPCTDGPRRVIWDHSAFGSAIRWPLPLGRDVVIAIGRPGDPVHEFVTLPALAARFPRATAEALR
jgi:hypothetical protein